MQASGQRFFSASYFLDSLLCPGTCLRKIAMLHAGCLCLYGLRLGLFLLYRETAIPRFRAFRETIEVPETLNPKHCCCCRSASTGARFAPGATVNPHPMTPKFGLPSVQKRAQERGSRLSRTPFILGCSVLYIGIAAPLMVSMSCDIWSRG
jgi:hypothetical protein